MQKSSVAGRLNELRNHYDPPLIVSMGKQPVGYNGQLVYVWTKTPLIRDGTIIIEYDTKGEAKIEWRWTE